MAGLTNQVLINFLKALGAPCPICQGRVHKSINHMGHTTKIKM